MGWFERYAKKAVKETLPCDVSTDVGADVSKKGMAYKLTLDEVEQILTGTYCSENMIELYKSIPEVAFPINFIINRITAGKFILKRTKDDSVVYDNKEVNQFLTKPNPLQSFEEFLTLHIAYKKITGNSFIRAAMLSEIKSKEVWKWCSNYWVLPSPNVRIETPFIVPMYSTARLDDIIIGYSLGINGTQETYNPNSILHSKEISIGSPNPLRGLSRLSSQKKIMSNLIAVYSARNIIYTKRGALGFFISKKTDELGPIPMAPDERKQIRDEYEETYGVKEGKSPIGIIEIPTEYVRVSMSIQELEPFKETLVDACQIAGAFEIPSQLIPREDHSTYSDQITCEKKVFTNVIIPEAQRFAKEITALMGLEESGLYIDVDFSGVDILKEGYKEEQATKAIVSKRCKEDFLCGVITLNDWRSQIGESKVDNPLYDKLSLEMSEEEINHILKLFAPKNGKGTNDNSLQDESK